MKRTMQLQTSNHTMEVQANEAHNATAKNEEHYAN